MGNLQVMTANRHTASTCAILAGMFSHEEATNRLNK